MSNFTTEDETQEKPELSLTKAVEDVSQHGFAQTEALKDKQRTLQSLQATLSEVEKKGVVAEQELRSKTREYLMLEGEMEHLEQQIKVLHDCCSCIRKENAELQIGISEAEEDACMALAKFNTYRNKMGGHRAAVLHAESQMEAHKQLEEKRALVQMLTQKKRELKEDLENPNGNTVQIAKRKIDAMKEEISMKRGTIAEKREQLQKELETRTQIKTEIQFKNRRFEAIVKRLHCQVARSQAVYRQMSEDVDHMEKQLCRLKEQLESSEDTSVTGQ